MPQPTIEELGEELGLDLEELGYWIQGGTIYLGEYVWYGPAIAAVPSGGSRTDNQKPSAASVIRLSKTNKEGQDVSNTLENLLTGGKIKYGSEQWTIDTIDIGADYVDINILAHSGPDENFLAVAVPSYADANVRTLKQVTLLTNIGFEPSEIEQPTIVPVPWTWQEVLDTLIANGVDATAIPWNPLELLAKATGEQNINAFEATADTMEWKEEISVAAKEDLIALTERTEEGTEIVPGPSRWEELWQITTIQTSLVFDARNYAIENYGD